MSAARRCSVKASAPAAGLFLALVLILAATLGAQTPPAKPAGPPPPPLLKVFLDWPGADVEALRADVPFADFVTSLAAAEIQVTVTPRPPAPQPSFAIEIRGQGAFQGQDNTLAYTPGPEEKPEDVRKGIAGMIEIGLLRYASKTALGKDLTVRFLDQAKPTSVNDPWRFWVFSLSGNAFLAGETQYRNSMYYASLSANRTTPAFKFRSSVFGNWSDYWFDLGDGTAYTAATHGYGGSALAVKSLGEHWSAGGFVEGQSS